LYPQQNGLFLCVTWSGFDLNPWSKTAKIPGGIAIHFVFNILISQLDDGQGSCTVDFGGPLVLYQTSEDFKTKMYLQVGIASGARAGCSRSKFPAIFARLQDRDVLRFLLPALGLQQMNERSQGNCSTINGHWVLGDL
jgi:hypothetical protein